MENPGGPAIPILSYGNIEGQWPLLCLDREEGGRRELKANYKRLCPSSSSRGRLSLPPTGNGANANWDKNDGDCSFCVATRSFLAPLSPLFTCGVAVVDVRSRQVYKPSVVFFWHFSVETDMEQLHHVPCISTLHHGPNISTNQLH